MKQLSLFSLVLVFIAALAPISLAFADAGATGSSVFDSLASIKENTPVTIYFTEKGGINSISYSLPSGFKVEVLKESQPKSSGMHSRSFDLWYTNRFWLDESHTAHYLEYGQGQAAWCSWTPDENTANFVGVYNVAGGYSVGLVNPSPNNVLVTVGSAGYYRPQASYYGSRPVSSPVHFQYNYYPWW